MSRARVLVVAQAFKGTLTLAEVAGALGRGVRAAGGDPVVVRGSDGGDGLLEALEPYLERTSEYDAEDPLGRMVRASVGWLDRRTAVIESRLVCGLSLLAPGERDPRRTTTRGVGSLISHVAADGARAVYVGLGGSATMDGGVGMARAWGWVPRDSFGAELPEGGDALRKLARFDDGTRPAAVLVGLTDVRHPLTGPGGARVFAAQKGASPASVERLARGLDRLAAVAREAGKAELAGHPGAGAAGGLGFGLLFFGAGALEPGARWVLDRGGFDAALASAALVVVGEGAFDRTSLEGKLAGEILGRARRRHVPVVLLAPTASDVPPDVAVESGGGRWSPDDLAERARAAVRRALGRLLAP